MTGDARSHDADVTAERTGKSEPSLPRTAKARKKAAEVKVQPTPATGKYASQGEHEDNVEEGQEFSVETESDPQGSD